MSKRNTPIPTVSTEGELADFLLKHLGENLKEAIRSTVSVLVKAEMGKMREDWLKETGQRLQFNGAYDRHLLSPAGKIENIPVARFREGLPQGTTLASMRLFADERARFHDLVANLHLSGISQRKIDRLCRSVLGTKVPPATTKHVFEELVEQEAFQVNNQSLMDAPATFLVLDGVWQSVKSQRTGETRRRVTLVALGMDEYGGNQRIFGFRLAFEEDEASWTEFLRSLEKRGLNLQATKLVIADGGGGLLTALERLAGDVPIQTCLSHRYRNTLKHTPHKLKGEMGKDLRKLTEAQTKDAFLSQVRHMEQRWVLLAPNAITSLLHHVELSTTYLDFPREVWVKIRTTNILDRAFREVRARTQIHFDHYQSHDSSNRYHQAILGDLNQRYFNAA